VNGPHQSHDCLCPARGEGGLLLATLAYDSRSSVEQRERPEVLGWVGVIWTARRGAARHRRKEGQHGTGQLMSWAAQAWAVEQHPGSGVRKAVLQALAYCANHETNLCNPRIETLCEMTDFRDRSVRDALASLEEDGYIGRVRMRHEDGTYGQYHYSFPALTPAASPADGNHPDQRRLPPVAPPASPAGQEPEVDLEPNPLRSEPSVVQDGLFVVDNGSDPHSPVQNSNNEDAVLEVFAYWREQRDKTHPNFRLTPRRRKVIADRLKHYTIQQLRHAIDGVGYDPWPDRARHDDLVVIFRNPEQVDRFLTFWRTRPKQRAPADDLIARNMPHSKLGRRRQK
jgi:hypothetical protein